MSSFTDGFGSGGSTPKSIKASPGQNSKESLFKRQLSNSSKTQRNQHFNNDNVAQLKEGQMHEIEKMVIKYAMSLFLFREMDQLSNFIENYAYHLDSSKLFMANLYRIQALLFQSQQNTQKCIDFMKKAKKLYKYKDSVYGTSLSRYSIALFQKKLLQQQISDQQKLDDNYQKIILKFDKALFGFKQVNHLIGQALCHNQISLIYKTRFSEQNSLHDIEVSKNQFQKHQDMQMKIMLEYQEYSQKKKCPHVKRIQGPEFSLMLELVLDLNNCNLFPVQQKYELQAIQEDEQEESVMFSDDGNLKEALKDQQDVLSQEYDNFNESTPKNKNRKQIHLEISKIYGSTQDRKSNLSENIIISGSRTLENSVSSKKHPNSIKKNSTYDYENFNNRSSLDRSVKQPQQVVPDNFTLLSARKPKQINQDLSFTSPIMNEEENKIYTCSPQESSINSIHSTEEFQLSQQAYFSQNSKRPNLTNSNLEIVQEETEQTYFDGHDKNQSQNLKFSFRNTQKLKSSYESADNKNKSVGSIVSVSMTIPSNFITKNRNSITDQKQVKKTVKPNAPKNKVIQINLKSLKQ